MDNFYVGPSEMAKRARQNSRSMQEERGSDDKDDSRKRGRDEDDDFSDPDFNFNDAEEESDEEQEGQRPRNSKRRKRQRRAEPKEKEERIRSSAQDEDGPSTSGPPPDFQLEGLDGRRNRDLEVRYRTDNWEDTTSESPEVEEQNPDDSEEGKEEDDDRASSCSGWSNSTTSLPENQRGFVGPLRDPQRIGAVPPDAPEAEADQAVQENEGEDDQGSPPPPPPLNWLPEFPVAQLFGMEAIEVNGDDEPVADVELAQDEEHLPHQEHARIREDDVPVLQQEMPRELDELHQGEELLLPQGALGAEMPRLHPDDLYLLEDNLPHQVHYGVHQDHGALNPQDQFEIFEDNELVHHQEMPRELVVLHREEDLLLAQGALGEEMPLLQPEDNLPPQEHFRARQEDEIMIPQDRIGIFEEHQPVHQAEDVLQEGGVRWPGEVSLHKYLSESGPLLPEEYFERQGEM